MFPNFFGLTFVSWCVLVLKNSRFKAPVCNSVFLWRKSRDGSRNGLKSSSVKGSRKRPYNTFTLKEERFNKFLCQTSSERQMSRDFCDVSESNLLNCTHIVLRHYGDVFMQTRTNAINSVSNKLFWFLSKVSTAARNVFMQGCRHDITSWRKAVCAKLPQRCW